MLPAIYLSVEAWKRFQFAGLSSRLMGEAWNTFALSAVATVAVLVCGLTVAYAARIFPQRGMAVIHRMASLGYAMPGTILALGILIAAGGGPLDRPDREVLAGHRSGAGPDRVRRGPGLCLSGAVPGDLGRVGRGRADAHPRSYDQSARTLGHGIGSTLRNVHLPLSKAALAAGDCWSLSIA
ncbi:hypothetical protein ACFSYD_20700 [Paracoccus aerius]